MTDLTTKAIRLIDHAEVTNSEYRKADLFIRAAQAQALERIAAALEAETTPTVSAGATLRPAIHHTA
ncbi:hypothetical protein ACWEGQ_00440 [Streptomyces seoulensis]